jgi:Domain of Unknown Function (DUF1206)
MPGDAGSRARGTAREAERGAQRAAANPTLEFAARAGWIVKGLLYAVMGVLAVGSALGRGGATDQKGSVELLTRIAGSVAGELLLIAIAVALAGYAVWSFFCAVFDPLGQGEDPTKGTGRRLGFVGSGAAYAALLLFCVQLMLGRSGGTSDSQVPKLVAGLLNQPLGPWLAGLAGLAAIGAGVGQVVEAFVSRFGKDLDQGSMDERERRTAVTLGRFGSASRGAVFVLLGWFVVQAAVFRDPHQAKGVGGALGTLAQQGAGRALLVALGLGFLAMAAYALATARWMRMPGVGTRR